ncbi:MAG: hypothetical protein Q8922_07640 [Bacteroidota bacterium]|nr:hypothetical protein [Bacteroidota bacterium]MDP4233235.1 hypothetical protein [Bacteroidota bacterium]MDP4242146.1 hypothetical protein [Bacteroidota bacterium]MDP4287795.1 hypothetical protein [Bacteroidota bacterium]
MKTLLAIVSIVLITATFFACSSPMNTSPGSVQLTSDKIQLAGMDTTGTVEAALSCGCPCMLSNMKVTGDTSVIRFNLAAHRTSESTHHITATATPSSAKPGTYTCVFSFMIHDPMEMGGMHDYPASIVATFAR